MDTNQSLRNAENSVRNLISYKLSKLHGDDWVSKCGVTAERIKLWVERRDEEMNRLGITDNRILYYSDFYDLSTILKKHWANSFVDVFGKLSKFEALWSILESYRNPDAHRRELLPYQEYLILGISGKIRTDITSYFSKMDTGESYFPRIEAIQDSLGNTWTHGIDIKNQVRAETILRPGDMIQFNTTAFDPLGEDLLYCYQIGILGNHDWSQESSATIEVLEDYIGMGFNINVKIKSNRNYHAMRHYDDSVDFWYVVLPTQI